MHNTVKCKLCGEILAQGDTYPNTEVVCGKCKPYSQRESKPMTISIDYDLTFTLNIPFWLNFCWYAIDCGNYVIITTGRQEADRKEIETTIKTSSIPIICAGDKYKRDAAKEAGYDVDVWIDDMPEFISDIAKKPYDELWRPDK